MEGWEKHLQKKIAPSVRRYATVVIKPTNIHTELVSHLLVSQINLEFARSIAHTFQFLFDIGGKGHLAILASNHGNYAEHVSL